MGTQSTEKGIGNSMGGETYQQFAMKIKQ